MKTVFGLQLAISKEGDEVFNTKTITDYIVGEISSQLNQKKFNINTYKHHCACFGKDRYEDRELKIIKYHEDVYNEKVTFKSSVTDNKFGNISQFILADHIRSGKIDKSLLLKDNEDSAIVVMLFESENKKLDEAIRSIGNNIYAEYFKYELN